MKNVAYTGSFDPITIGHIWVIEESLKLFDKVYLIIDKNYNKKHPLLVNEKKEILYKKLFKKYGNRVEIVFCNNELSVSAAKDNNCNYIIRDVRNVNDYIYEDNINNINTMLNKKLKTIYLLPPNKIKTISSSVIKEMINIKGGFYRIEKMLPTVVYNEIVENFIYNSFEKYVYKISPIFYKKDFFNDIFSKYNESYRNYHNLIHIAHCLQELDSIEDKLKKEEKQNIYLSILFHDIEYKINDNDNELLSAKYFDKIAKKYGMDIDVDIVKKYIMSTKSIEMDKNKEEKIIQGIDYSILAQDRFVYKKYIKKIKDEFSEIDNFSENRKCFLNYIKSKIIFDEFYFKGYNYKMSSNIDYELSKLKGK